MIGKDRIVPAESDPIDLSVFCVEPGRWVATSGKFGSIGALAMVSPKVRAKAMVDKDQAKVWSEVRNSQAAMGGLVPAPAAREVAETSSYARVMQNSEVQKKVDSVAEPIRRDYESLIKQLRDRNAVGVVVAMNGQIIWADIFASTNLLEKYWPKLIRSYAAEAVMSRAKGAEVSRKAAQDFLADRADIQLFAHTARQVVEGLGVKFLANEPLEIPAQAAADARFDLARNLNAFDRVPRVDVEFDWLKDWLLISTPKTRSGDQETNQRVFHGGRQCNSRAREKWPLPSRGYGEAACACRSQVCPSGLN